MTFGADSREWRNEQGARQQLLNLCLADLCEREMSSAKEEAAIARGLLAVYSDGEFRHRYADVLAVLRDSDFAATLDAGKRAQYVSTRANGLAQNIKRLYTHECGDECENLQGGCPVAKLQSDSRLFKLYDHVNLEACRAGYEAESIIETMDALEKSRDELNRAEEQLDAGVKASREVSGETELLKSDLAKANEAVAKTMQASTKSLGTSQRAQELAEKALEKADRASEKARRLQLETISILGVFSAIILAFNEGVVFSTSSIAAVDRESPYQIAFVVAIVGFILFNSLYGAFALIYRLVRPQGDADHLLRPRRIVGIELAAAGCTAFLGTLAYSYDIEFWNLQAIALAISLSVFMVGIFAIAFSGHRWK